MRHTNQGRRNFATDARKINDNGFKHTYRGLSSTGMNA